MKKSSECGGEEAQVGEEVTNDEGSRPERGHDGRRGFAQDYILLCHTWAVGCGMRRRGPFIYSYEIRVCRLPLQGNLH